MFNPVKVPEARLRAVVSAEQARHDWAPTVWAATAADDGGAEAIRTVLATGPAVVLVVGGDGTLRVAAIAMEGTGVPMAVVPMGTGNLFARNLRLPLNDLVRAVRTAFTGTDRPIDLAFAELERPDHTVERHGFLVMAGVGLDATMAADTSPRLKKRLGWVAYSDPILRSVFGNAQFDVRYRVDEAPWRPMRAHTIIVGNCGTLTANVLLLPDAAPDDGFLDAVAFRPRGAVGWSKIGYGLSSNRFLHRTRFGRLLGRFLPTSRTLRYVRARRLEVAFDHPERLQLDGDPFGVVVGATLTVHEHALVLREPART
ncbi:diacylglycerol kinase family protein [Curtobacterium sp. ISL-83]|uniref:diacylglycerol/lipid kinase family protein n=1 Tax=Curtobacterium sp. ISL-83 TaxID=2819145 RepID=UPI001BEB8EDF|nr:diacylglycerol kinase family protein [Curtobacterium sp. ISL-83]MBT2502485.1 NAD(+)/NADH kinase [Curtobacterium sp. ISL-83]